MRALLSTISGGPETLVLETVDDPVPGADEVVIDVEACGVNYPDVLIIDDRYQVRPPRPFSPGAEVCGYIGAVGADVTAFATGERVVARCTFGGMAEKLKVSAARCLAVPRDLPAVALATLQMTYGTAFYALHDRGSLREGEKLLVLGAAGGVGSAAVELGKAFGAKVFAASSTHERLAFARSRGADETILYPAALDDAAGKRFASAIKDAAGPGGIDVVVDPVGGAYTEPALRSLTKNGRLLIVGFTAGIARLPMNLPLLKSCSLIGVNWGYLNDSEPERSAANARRIIEMYASGRLAHDVPEIFALEDAGIAIRRMSERALIGKAAIRMAAR